MLCNLLTRSKFLHLRFKGLFHGLDALLLGCRFCWLQKRFCRLTAFAVFDDIGKLGVAATVASRLGKADLDVEVSVAVHFYSGQAKRGLQLTGGSGIILGAASDD